MSDTKDVIDRFNDAFGKKDVDAVMALMTDDVVFDNTIPPDGQKYVGQDAVRGFWQSLFGSNPNGRFDTEEMFCSGDRCTALWLFTFDSTDPNSGHVRGVDVFKVRDGKVAEKFSYVKG